MREMMKYEWDYQTLNIYINIFHIKKETYFDVL
jgi:hypothetical protein